MDDRAVQLVIYYFLDCLWNFKKVVKYILGFSLHFKSGPMHFESNLCTMNYRC